MIWIGQFPKSCPRSIRCDAQSARLPLMANGGSSRGSRGGSTQLCCDSCESRERLRVFRSPYCRSAFPRRTSAALLCSLRVPERLAYGSLRVAAIRPRASDEAFEVVGRPLKKTCPFARSKSRERDGHDATQCRSSCCCHCQPWPRATILCEM